MGRLVGANYSMWRYFALVTVAFSLLSLYYLHTSQSDLQKLRPLVDSLSGLRSSLDQFRLVLAGADTGAPPLPPATTTHITLLMEKTSSRPLMEEEDRGFESFEEDINVHLWIDVPNSFPWRKCLNKYVDRIITYDCAPQEYNQRWRLIRAEKDKEGIPAKRFVGFKIANQVGECATPRPLAPGTNLTLVGVAPCNLADHEGFWRWRRDARLEWSEGGCLASQGGQTEVKLSVCDEAYEDQIVEIGVVLANQSIAPIMPDVWAARHTRLRNQELKASQLQVSQVLADLAESERSGELMSVSGSRRAVVFYVDKGSGFLKYLTWWLFAWKSIGLNAPEEAFDIILMTHPDSVGKLPRPCHLIPPDFDPRTVAAGPGRCLYRPLVGIAERDHRYDDYLNSQECLVNKEASGFLRHYKLLMRADLDTFPTPRMIGYWPTDIICNRNAVTTHYLANIENAIKAAAKDAGIEHKGWHNTDSAWFGPANRVLALANLTLHLARFTRAHMFGPGTACRCATCTALPQECQWGSGPYAGTLLLYAQEIAMNRIWTQREYDEQKEAILDSSCTDNTTSICRPALLHARHNSDPFSKFTFVSDGYRDYDMSNLDITNPRDYAMYMAIASSRQGLHGSRVMDNYRQNVGQGIPLSKLCANNPPYLATYQHH